MKKEHHFLADLVLDILQTTICLQRHQKAFQNNKASKQQSHVARYFIKHEELKGAQEFAACIH